MDRLRHIAVWGLLATLVVGGVGGPVVHRVHHAGEQIAEPREACHPASVHHAETATLTENAELEALSCDLCATRLLVLPPDLAPTSAPRVVGTTRVTLRSHLAPVHVVTDRTIRGPPSVSGSRLA